MLFDLPGARSAPFDFTNFEGDLGEEGGPPPCAVEPSCDTTLSPICSYAISAGDNTIAMCNPTKPNCPMSRRLVPERNIDAGRWSLVDEPEMKKDHKKKKNFIKKTETNYLMYIIFAIILYLVMRNI